MNIKNSKKIVRRYSIEGVKRWIYATINSSLFLHQSALAVFFWINRYKVKFGYLLFRRISLFQIEIPVTTICSLKCRDCSVRIPLIKTEYKKIMTFEEFKSDLDNILLNISSLQYLRLLGGEPLLNKSLPDMVRYSLKSKKVKCVIITTNGTIIPSDELIEALKTNVKKSKMVISNYSKNKELDGRLKVKEIVDKCELNGINVYYSNNFVWYKTTPVIFHNRTAKENRKYFLRCASDCVAAANGKLFPCNRQGAFEMLGVFSPKEDIDFLSLKKPIEKRDYARLFTSSDFEGCQYCDCYREQKGEPILPAIQIK
ncbi:MAG: 4Fe-4S cluster-binding domain-containing protein [Elusimicrobiota bacterium]|jgi:organic radical activating enzyme|nr:4Fe-4S cluster-binding domain-containing protein [Elusimicrobiota bacterium]